MAESPDVHLDSDQKPGTAVGRGEFPSLRELLVERDGIADCVNRTAGIKGAGLITSVKIPRPQPESVDNSPSPETVAKLADRLSTELTSIRGSTAIPAHLDILLNAIIHKLKDLENAGTPSNDQRFSRLKKPEAGQLEVEYGRARQALQLCEKAHLLGGSFEEWKQGALTAIAAEEQEDAGRKFLIELFKGKRPYKKLSEEERATAIAAVKEEIGEEIDNRTLRLLLLAREDFANERLNKGEPQRIPTLRADLLEALDLPPEAHEAKRGIRKLPVKSI